MPVARVVQLASHLEQKRLADIAYETRRFVRIGESDVVINQRIADKSQPIIKIYHYHCNHLGTPQELSDDKGDIIWLSYDRAWGGNFDSLYKQQFVDNWAIDENELQPFKFQGQCLDIETDLHYNRFRYYDSDVGMFVSRDPIGLLGGFNVFQYALNPTEWIDPFGLSALPLVRYKPNKVTPIIGNRQNAIDLAWEQEQDLVKSLCRGTRNWSDKELALIKNTPTNKLSEVMSRIGYTGHHINSVRNNGQLGIDFQGDPRNIIFLENFRHPNSSPQPNAYNEHFHSPQGHRGSTRNVTRGRLIDRVATLQQGKKLKLGKCKE